MLKFRYGDRFAKERFWLFEAKKQAQKSPLLQSLMSNRWLFGGSKSQRRAAREVKQRVWLNKIMNSSSEGSIPSVLEEDEDYADLVKVTKGETKEIKELD